MANDSSIYFPLQTDLGSHNSDNQHMKLILRDIISVAPPVSTATATTSVPLRAPSNEDGLRDLNTLSLRKASETCVL